MFKDTKENNNQWKDIKFQQRNGNKHEINSGSKKFNIRKKYHWPGLQQIRDNRPKESKLEVRLIEIIQFQVTRKEKYQRNQQNLCDLWKGTILNGITCITGFTGREDRVEHKKYFQLFK